MSKHSEERQKAILESVERLVGIFGRPVTPKEVATDTNIPVTTVRYHALHLAAAGKLVRHFGGRGLGVAS